jgi:hypothetical protein
MIAIWKFRFLTLLSAVFIGGISLANLIAEFRRPMPLTFAVGNQVSPTAEQLSSAEQASAIAPFRSDLLADNALGVATQMLKSGVKGQPEKLNAENAVKAALKIAPHQSRMWLLLALVQASGNPANPFIPESLKMSYLTGPNQAEIIPIRLSVVTANNALRDSDLGDLARSDVRALLTQLRDQRQTLVTDYAIASEVGKKFLEQSVSVIDPGFSDQLQKSNAH